MSENIKIAGLVLFICGVLGYSFYHEPDDYDPKCHIAFAYRDIYLKADEYIREVKEKFGVDVSDSYPTHTLDSLAKVCGCDYRLYETTPDSTLKQETGE